MATGDPSQADPRRLALLLGLSGDGRDWREDELAALLGLQLATPLDPDSPDGGKPASTLREVLCEARPSLERLTRIKESARSAREMPDGPLPESVVSVIYFASIAAALSRCHARISSLEDKVLREGIAWSLKRRWLDPALRPVLEEARAQLETDPPSRKEEPEHG